MKRYKTLIIREDDFHLLISIVQADALGRKTKTWTPQVWTARWKTKFIKITNKELRQLFKARKHL